MKSLLQAMAGLVVVALLATGCDHASTGTSTPTPTPLSKMNQWRANAQAQSRSLLHDLGKVKPSLDNSASMESAMSVCAELSAGKPRREVIRNAGLRFGVPRSKARRIVAVSAKYLCPDLA